MQANDTIASLGSLEAWRRAVSLATGALRCRWMSELALTVLFTAIVAAAAALLPRTYSAESRLLIKKNYVMPALAHPKRAVPLGSEAPAQSAAEFVLNRVALQGIADRLRLVDRWDAQRAAVLRAKDRLSARIKGPMPTEEKTDAIVDVLAGTWGFILLVSLHVDISLASWIGTFTVFGIRVLALRYRLTLPLP